MGRLSGIYIIHCIKNNKFYIGSSINIKGRWHDHKSWLKQNRHKNQHLQYAYNLYGKEYFIFSILEQCEKEVFKDRESYWIRFYNSTDPDKGFNILIPDEEDIWLEETIGRRNKLKESKLIKVRKIYNPIICINKHTGEKMEYDNASVLAKAINCPETKVRDIASYWSGKSYNLKSWHNYTFIKKKDFKEGFDYINYKKPSSRIYNKGYKLKPRSFSKQAMKRRGEI